MMFVPMSLRIVHILTEITSAQEFIHLINDVIDTELLVKTKMFEKYFIEMTVMGSYGYSVYFSPIFDNISIKKTHLKITNITSVLTVYTDEFYTSNLSFSWIYFHN